MPYSKTSYKENLESPENKHQQQKQTNILSLRLLTCTIQCVCMKGEGENVLNHLKYATVKWKAIKWN